MTPQALQVWLPRQLKSILWKYYENNGIAQIFYDFLYKSIIDVGSAETHKINNKDWYAQRTDER